MVSYRGVCVRVVDEMIVTVDSQEICDFGFPQNTEAETLKLFITTEGVRSERAMVRFFPCSASTNVRTKASCAIKIEGGGLKNCNSSHRGSSMATTRHQIPKERSIYRRHRKCEFVDERER